MIRSVHAVLFDLDNTLADRDGAFQAWAAWFARERLQIGDATIIEGVVAEMTALDSGGRAAKDVVFRTLKERYPQLADSVEHLVAEFRERMVTHLPPLDPGAARLLDALDGASLPWGIVSNGSPTQVHRVRALGLDARAGCVVISEIVGARKPEPAIFLHAATALGADPKDVIFVGDHPETDVLGAFGAGMSAAWLRRGREWPASLIGREPDHVVDSLEELLWIVEPSATERNAPAQAWRPDGRPEDHVMEKSAP